MPGVQAPCEEGQRQLDPNREGLGPCRRVLEGPEQGGEQGEQLLDIWPRDLVR